MKIQRSFAICCSLVLLSPALVTNYVAGKEKKGSSKSYVCSEQNPGQMCSADTTCGSDSAPCSADIKRAGSGATVTPGIAGAKANKPFCVRAGTTVTWKSETKNAGFVLDFGPSSPFDQGTIIGGSDRPITTVAKKPGCYRFSAGVCVSGEAYGMCGETTAEMVVTAGN